MKRAMQLKGAEGIATAATRYLWGNTRTQEQESVQTKGVEGNALQKPDVCETTVRQNTHTTALLNITKPVNVKGVEEKALHKPGVCEAKHA